MSDLLDRLKDMVDLNRDVMREAIAEIVKLEAQHGKYADQIARLWEQRETLRQKTEAQAAHITKLEAALRFYATDENWRHNGQLDPNSGNFTGGPARAALGEKE